MSVQCSAGTEPEALERVFQPFYTTKSNGYGNRINQSVDRLSTVITGGSGPRPTTARANIWAVNSCRPGYACSKQVGSNNVSAKRGGAP